MISGWTYSHQVFPCLRLALIKNMIDAVNFLTRRQWYVSMNDYDPASAKNLAELSLGTGAAVDTGSVVLVAAVLDQASPPNMRYTFDHPAYAKYLD